MSWSLVFAASGRCSRLLLFAERNTSLCKSLGLRTFFLSRAGTPFAMGMCRSVTAERRAMLKITCIDGQDSTQTFKLEGKLLEPWVAEVLRLCTLRKSQSGRTQLDLSGLTFVDQAGAKLLSDLLSRGLVVSACSGFVAELLHLENP
jgi:ABC-type transporter Mla MlaB component